MRTAFLTTLSLSLLAFGGAMPEPYQYAGTSGLIARSHHEARLAAAEDSISHLHARFASASASASAEAYADAEPALLGLKKSTNPDYIACKGRCNGVPPAQQDALYKSCKQTRCGHLEKYGPSPPPPPPPVLNQAGGFANGHGGADHQ
ncbi:hypothetical protein MMC11_002336 [Xylographa trunciseda]|nr:hypothetical protein [Xylographa trunciseda]